MDVADQLCDELFHWIDQQELCADNLMALAIELEVMREARTTGQLVGNTATALGSATLIGTGIVTFLTGGLAAPLLVAAASITAGAGTVTSLTFSLVESWKSCRTMKNAQKTFDQISKICNDIERLQKKLAEKCESEDLKESSSDEVQNDITARILRALAKRSGRDLSISHVRWLLRSDAMDTHYRYPGFNPNNVLKYKARLSLAALGISLTMLEEGAAAKGAQYSTQLFGKAAATNATKTVLKGTGQVAGGVLGLVFSVPDLINNCEELIKNKHQTEASTQLRSKANEIREAVKNLKEQLKELQEMLNQIPEIEFHIDLAQEMLDSQIYTRGTICVEYKQTQNQETKTQDFILVCTKDIGGTRHGSTGKHKSDQNKNKRQKSALNIDSTSSLKQQRKRAETTEQEEEEEEEEEKKKEYHLPKIIMSNVRSLPNKMEEIKEMMEDDEYWKDSDLMFFTETWLKDNSPEISLEGYESSRVDRDKWLTHKSRGGGQLMLVNKAWATDVEVENIKLTPDYELMVVSIKPHEHPKRAPPLIFIHVYVPGPNFTHAAIEIAHFYYVWESRSGGGPVFLLGDFNKCDIDSYLNHLDQYVTCSTRKDKTLDKCFGNVPGAYRSECRPPLGKSDHNVIHLFPKILLSKIGSIHMTIPIPECNESLCNGCSNVGKAYRH